MKKNDTFTVTVEDMGMNGEGIGKYQGMTFFIKDAVVGDVIEAAATKLKKNYGYARLVRILKPSPYRVEPGCPAAKVCGGCQMQALSYEKQLEQKQKKVRENLHRIGGFSEELLDQVFEPIVGMDEPFRYRNKAQFPVGYDKNGEIAMGFYAARSHRIIPVDDCLLGVEENARILDIVREYMEKRGVKPYDEQTGKGLIRHILIRKGFASGEIMVCLIINGTSLPDADVLCARLATIPGMTSITININQKNTNVILGERTETLWGQGYITDSIGDISFEISPRSFYQVNPVQTRKLYGLALEYAQLTGQEIVWDLYCGIGTISLFLARAAKQVYGVEIVPEAIEDARRNAANNGISNAHFYVGKAEEVVPRWMEGGEEESGCVLAGDAVEEDTNREEPGGVAGARRRPDVIVVDPPRKGCDPACLATMLAAAPKRIVYVSCDPATLARDLKGLADGGYELKRVRAVDQFCHSMHCEVVAEVVRKNLIE